MHPRGSLASHVYFYLHTVHDIYIASFLLDSPIWITHTAHSANSQLHFPSASFPLPGLPSQSVLLNGAAVCLITQARSLMVILKTSLKVCNQLSLSPINLFFKWPLKSVLKPAPGLWLITVAAQPSSYFGFAPSLLKSVCFQSNYLSKCKSCVCWDVLC